MKSEKSKWLYFNNKSNSCRYILGEKGDNILACIGVSPTMAKPGEFDDTLRSVKRIAELNGFDGWLMYNLYPQIVINPVDLEEEINNKENSLNISLIVKSLEQLKIKTVWLAWGDNIEAREYLKYCLYKLSSLINSSELCLNYKIVNIPTMAGNPMRPVYKDVKLELYDFDLEKYISEKVTKSLVEKYDGVKLNGVEFK